MEHMERNFYEVTELAEGFKVSKDGDHIATLECEELEQYSIALIAERNGKKSVYLPVRTDYNRYDFSQGLVCVKDDAYQVLYYQNPTVIDCGILIMQVSTGEDGGYWTAINLYSMSYFLTAESAQQKLQETFTIPYKGSSCATIRHEFDYLLYQCMLEVDGKLYIMQTEKSTPLVRGIGAAGVEKTSFKEYFKVISEKGEESFQSFNSIWGPFHKIEFNEIIFDSEFYCGSDEDGNIRSVFYNRAVDDDSAELLDNEIAFFMFEEPVKKMEIVEAVEADEGEFTIWRLKYSSSEDKDLFLCSITNTSSLQHVIPGKYF